MCVLVGPMLSLNPMRPSFPAMRPTSRSTPLARDSGYSGSSLERGWGDPAAHGSRPGLRGCCYPAAGSRCPRRCCGARGWTVPIDVRRHVRATAGGEAAGMWISVVWHSFVCGLHLILQALGTPHNGTPLRIALLVYLAGEPLCLCCVFGDCAET